MQSRFYFALFALLAVLPAINPSPALAAPLLTENFDAATINTQRWDVWSALNNEPIALGGADYALKLTGTADGHSGIYSKTTYSRGENMRVTFKLWNSGGFLYSTISGPWINPDWSSKGWQYPGLNWVEAGFAGQDNNGSQTFWGEGSAIWGWLPLETGFLNAWKQAKSKAAALQVRVWLGNTTGARLEWSQDGGYTYTGVKGAAGPFNNVVIDTRGMPAGQNYYANNKVSSSAVKVGFSGGFSEATYVDDLVVENDSHLAPTPTPASNAQVAYPFSEDFETDPFAGATPRWQAYGNCTWSTAQAHGGSHSVRLQGQSPYTQNNRLVTHVNGIPQTGTIEIQWYNYFTQFDATNVNHLMHLGTDTWDGQYPTLTIGATGARLKVYDGRNAWDQGPGIDMPLNTWIRHRIILYLDYKEYDYYVKVGDQAEEAFAEIKPLGASLWGAGVNYRSLMIMPFVANTFFIDDLSVGQGPPPIPTPTPYPTPGPFPSSSELLDINKLMPPGHSYTDTVPDTLDTAERARLSINALTSTIAPGTSYCYHLMYFGTNPPVEDAPQGYTYKHVRALPKLRTMCGSDQNLQVEFNLMKNWLNACASAIPSATGLNMTNGGTGMAVYNWYARDQNPKWLQFGQALSRALEHSATYNNRQDYAYYGTTEPASDTNDYCDGSTKYSWAFMIRPMITNSILKQDPISLTQAGRIVRFMMLPRMWDQPGDEDYSAYAPYVPQYPGEVHGTWSGHSHGGLVGLHGLLVYAIAANDNALKEVVRKGYEHLRAVSHTRLAWSPLWFPRGANGCTSYGYAADACEPCSVGEITMLAVMLAEAGIGDYWDDVENYLRNGMAEQQITNVNVLRQVSGSTSPILDKYVGASVGANRPSWGEALTWGCCTANTAIAWYYGWQGTTQFDAGQGVATVNLLLNRAAAWLDVYSYIPYEGKVEIRNRQASTIRVRMPGWVNLAQTTAMINNIPYTPAVQGRYLLFDDLKTSDLIRVQFPLAEGMESVRVGSTTYQLHVRGATVLTVTPNAAACAGMPSSWDSSGKKYPMYERASQGQGPAPMHQVTRFIADRLIPLQSQWMQSSPQTPKNRISEWAIYQ